MTGTDSWAKAAPALRAKHNPANKNRQSERGVDVMRRILTPLQMIVQGGCGPTHRGTRLVT